MGDYKIISMTREEAFLAMRMGSKVAHWSFTSSGYLHMPSGDVIFTEDLCEFNREFFSPERSEFQNGWEIFKKGILNEN